MTNYIVSATDILGFCRNLRLIIKIVLTQNHTLSVKDILYNGTIIRFSYIAKKKNLNLKRTIFEFAFNENIHLSFGRK